MIRLTAKCVRLNYSHTSRRESIQRVARRHWPHCIYKPHASASMSGNNSVVPSVTPQPSVQQSILKRYTVTTLAYTTSAAYRDGNHYNEWHVDIGHRLDGHHVHVKAHDSASTSVNNSVVTSVAPPSSVQPYRPSNPASNN